MGVILFLGLALLAATDATKIANLKRRVDAQNTAMIELGAVGPFKLHHNELMAKVSKVGVEVALEKAQQDGAWNSVEGSALMEAWSISGTGLHIKKDQKEIPCKSAKGLDTKSAVTIVFACDAALVEQGAETRDKTKEGKSWPIKTGYEANAAGTTEGFEPRVRFWHRCSSGNTGALSMCNQYNYIGADAAGYYGCQYLTEDGYCIKSFRHEWVEFNPNDLPYAYNPASPCTPTAADPCGPPAGRYVPNRSAELGAYSAL